MANAGPNPCTLIKKMVQFVLRLRLGKRGYLNSRVFRFYGFKPVHINAEDQPCTANAIRRASATQEETTDFIREPAAVVPQEGYC
jgi:hypothetical protein